jgi:hypothetical protein
MYVNTKTWDGDFTWGTTKQMREIKNQFYPRMYQSDRFIEDRKYKVQVLNKWFHQLLPSTQDIQ